MKMNHFDGVTFAINLSLIQRNCSQYTQLSEIFTCVQDTKHAYILAFTNSHFPRVIYYSRAHNASNFTLCHLRM